MTVGTEIVRQINVVREVIDVTKNPGPNSKGPFIGNYPVDIENPNEGDLVIFHRGKWRKFSIHHIGNVTIIDKMVSKFKKGNLYYNTIENILYLAISDENIIAVGGKGILGY